MVSRSLIFTSLIGAVTAASVSIGGIVIVRQDREIISLEKKIEDASRELRGIEILYTQDGKLDKISLTEILGGDAAIPYQASSCLFTPEAVEEISSYKSPFRKDKKSFHPDRYIRNRYTDNYNSPRRKDRFRYHHKGIDLTVPVGTKLYPLMAEGIVTEVSDDPHHLIPIKNKTGRRPIEYGRIVRIVYPNGLSSLYAHLRKVKVHPGEKVEADTLVGETGISGNSAVSGKPPHLHLELYKGEEPIDPLTYSLAPGRLDTNILNTYLDER